MMKQENKTIKLLVRDFVEGEHKIIEEQEELNKSKLW